MRKLVFLSLAAAFAALPLQAAPRLAPEARLASFIEGRQAGEPVSCINLRNVRSTHIIDGTAIVYRVGSTVYVNRPRAGAESLRRWDGVTARPFFANQLCSTEVLQLFDPASGTSRGSVFLGEFVPYRNTGIIRR